MTIADHRLWLPLAHGLVPLVDAAEQRLTDLLAQGASSILTALTDARSYAYREVSEPSWCREVALALVCLMTHGSICTSDPRPALEGVQSVLGTQAPQLAHWFAPFLEPSSPLSDLLDLARDRIETFAANARPAPETIVYFYEALTQAIDDGARQALGVFYTPPQLVAFIVKSVDAALAESKIASGLGALSDSWTILDPAMGTGLFLFEVVDLVLNQVPDRTRCWHDQLRHQLRGYELSLAPLVLAHLELARRLEGLGVEACGPVDFRWANPLDAVYGPLLMARLEEAIIVGNPPYRSVSSNRNAWLDGLLSTYRETPQGEMVERGNRNQLQDDYVKFIRLADEVVARRGIIAMVTNSSFYDGPWFRAMRYQLLAGAQRLDLLNLHGGALTGSERHGRDENVFAIATPVAVTLILRSPDLPKPRGPRFGELRGSRAEKLAILARTTTGALCKETLSPSRENYWRYVPFEGDDHREWQDWVPLPELFESWGAAVLTNRNGLAVDVHPEALREKIRRFADLSIPTAVIEADYGFRSNYRWDTEAVRRRFSTSPIADLVTPYLFRPFDHRYVYWHPDIVYNMRGDKLAALRTPGRSLGLMFSRNTRRGSYTNVFVTDALADRDCLEKANIAPLHRFDPVSGNLVCNLAPALLAHFSAITEEVRPEDIFHYIYAVLWSKSYRQRYFPRLRMEFPRIPLGVDQMLFKELSALGGELVRLHLIRPETGEISGPLPALDAPCWDVRIGGYRVMRKYLRSRGLERTRASQEPAIKVIAATLDNTVALTARIDALIENHGDWTEAFRNS